jgi:hypothetical protein
MNCLECIELLQRRLDESQTATLPDDAATSTPDALADHLAGCPSCRQQHQAAQALLTSLCSRHYMAPAENLTQRIVAGVLQDRHTRRLALRRRLYVTLALAASILIMALAGYIWLPPAKERPDPTTIAKEKSSPSPNPGPQDAPPVEPSLGAMVEEYRADLAALPGKLADKTEPVRQFLVAANPMDLIPPMPTVPNMEEPLEPAVQSLRHTTQGISEGIQTVAGRTRQAFSYFAKLSPIESGPN